jgi:hypothetical protein
MTDTVNDLIKKDFNNMNNIDKLNKVLGVNDVFDLTKMDDHTLAINSINDHLNLQDDRIDQLIEDIKERCPKDIALDDSSNDDFEQKMNELDNMQDDLLKKKE